MWRFCSWLLLAALALAQVACSTPRRYRKRAPKPSAETEAMAKARRPLQRVGVVSVVNESDGFVLIDSGSLPTPADGARLRSYTGPDVSGELKASAVRRRPFVVADIVEGNPRVGDEIFEAAPEVAVAVKP